MKTIIFVLWIGVGCLLTATAQNKVDLTISYNQAASRYEVYAIPTFSASSFRLGASQITVVLPAAAVANTPLSVSSIGGGLWSDEPQVYAPASQNISDFHAVATTGSGSMLLNFTAGVPTLLFSFKLAEGCVAGVRLFNNGSDPGSTAAGMNNGDFRNNFFGTSSVTVGELYGVNTNNNGTGCQGSCSLIAPTLSK